MSNNNIDDVLKILSNTYRRKILRLLSTEDRYAYELAKILKITPRAITKHLEQLKEYGLVNAQMRRSAIGPSREYYTLNRGLVFRISIGQNLFYSNLSSLRDDGGVQVSPTMHLEAPEETFNIEEIIEQGLTYLPQILDELDYLEIQQTRLLRRYQGILQHIGELLKKFGLETSESELVVTLMENGGRMRQGEILDKLSLTPVTLSPLVESLIAKNIIEYNVIVENGKAPEVEYKLKMI